MVKARLLLVEDSKTQATPAIDFLTSEGYDVLWVEDGKSAIKAAKTGNIDLILLDLMLPDMNGNEVCRWLKLNHDTRSIPIIMLTAMGSASDKVSGFEAGADDYLAKPYSDMELNARIYACLRTKALQDELRQKNRQLEEMLAKVEELAITDPLTGLYNRRRFESVLDIESRRARRYNAALACLIIDLDHFKSINDEYGHQAGDMVLKEMAQIMKAEIRSIDTVARWGGEEFALLLPQTTKEHATQVSERLLRKIAVHEFTKRPEIRVTVSIGISGMPDPAIDTGEKLVNAADLALYEAKRKGRNRVEVV